MCEMCCGVSLASSYRHPMGKERSGRSVTYCLCLLDVYLNLLNICENHIMSVLRRLEDAR